MIYDNMKIKIGIILLCALYCWPVISLAQYTNSRASSMARDKSEVEMEEKEELVYLNANNAQIEDVIKQISQQTGKNFIIDKDVRGSITILSSRPMTKSEAYQAFLSALEVAGFTTATGPGGIIKIVKKGDASSSNIPVYVDTTPETDSYITRLITLQNIQANTIVQAITQGKLLSKTASMFAYPATNTIIVTDSGTNIDRLMKIIKELDQEEPQQVLEIIPIQYADAKDVAKTVMNIFEIKNTAARSSTRTSRRRTSRSRNTTSTQAVGSVQEVSKIIADERTNSVIVYASKRAIKHVRAMIAKLDVPLSMGESGNIHVHHLKYTNAKEMAQTLSAVTQKASASSKKKGSKSAPVVARLGEGINIGADEVTNALIITASAKDYKRLVEDLIDKLDVPRRQVFLESVVMELRVGGGSQTGITGYGGMGTGSLMGFGSIGHDGFSPANFFTPGGIFSTPGMLGGLLSQDDITITVPGDGGSSQDLTIPAFAAFLNFLSSNTQANIHSTPNILTLDNQKASIEVNDTIYAEKRTQSGTTGFETIEPTPLDAGLTLEITPQITYGDAVRLEIHQKLSNFTSAPNPRTGAANTSKREIQTTVVAMDGQTVVLGGLMQDSDRVNRSKIPILGDIPVLGWLFSRKVRSHEKSNLIVFITPYVIRTPADFADITKTKIEQRNDFIKDNFRKRQQRQIRKVIARHRADLLEFTEPVVTRPHPDVQKNDKVIKSKMPNESSSRQSKIGSKNPILNKREKKNIITVPSIDSSRRSSTN